MVAGRLVGDRKTGASFLAGERGSGGAIEVDAFTGDLRRSAWSET